MTPEHWAVAYIGEPWVAQENDCWAFCRRVWHLHFGIDVPAVDVDAGSLRSVTRAFSHHVERANWVDVEIPAEGDAVLLAHSRFPSHVGIWVDADGGGVLHCQDPMGVVFSTRAALARAGWGRLQFYRHVAP